MFSQILGDDSIRNPTQAVDPMKILATFATSRHHPRGSSSCADGPVLGQARLMKNLRRVVRGAQHTQTLHAYHSSHLDAGNPLSGNNVPVVVESRGDLETSRIIPEEFSPAVNRKGDKPRTTLTVK
jgi:hypothetical protein